MSQSDPIAKIHWLYLPDHIEGSTDYPVDAYLRSDIDAIPKLLLPDTDMRILRDLLGAANWIRDLQSRGYSDDSVRDIFDADKTFCMAQAHEARRLILKFDKYLQDNHVPQLKWINNGDIKNHVSEPTGNQKVPE